MEDKDNIAETIAREARKPVALNPSDHVVALPDGFTAHDLEKYLLTPLRKRGKVALNDADSFIEYIKNQGSLTNTTIWCNADFIAGKVDFTAILNDYGGEENQVAWRDHLAAYAPVMSEEWRRWDGKDKEAFGQAEFAAFLEENLKDIASVDNSPTGAQMLEMAISFEATQDSRFKSAIRLQNGAVEMNFTLKDDDQTVQKMQVFERFSLGLPVYWNGDAYRIDARLRYRTRDGKLTFWYELIRADKVLEDATKTLITKIKGGTGKPILFGKPFA